MIVGLDGPVVVVPAAVAARLARPLERLVVQARRNGERIDPELLAVIGDFERLRRALAAARSSDCGTPEPSEAEPGVEPGHDLDLDTVGAADVLGCSPSYVRRLARQRRIGVRVGSAWRFSVADLVGHCQSRKDLK